ncbi:MAG: HAD hydrolase family protein [Verrucomicrobiae bacterium]|nr:HAD hydrolase family protein [Verrucomicrobiae bacterium]
MSHSKPPLTIELPGRSPLVLNDLVLDFTGTLSLDGALLPGVAERLHDIAKRLRITVLTADTFGKATEALRELPVETRLVATGLDKAHCVARLGAEHVVAIGNGRNDARMIRLAALGIAVIGPEGAAGELMAVADVVVRDIREALDLLLHPLRLKATLRD